MPRVAFMKSRVDFTAISMLSVPPEVVLPQTCPPQLLLSLPSIAAVMATTSASQRATLGKISGCKGFVCENLHNQVMGVSLAKQSALQSPNDAEVQQ